MFLKSCNYKLLKPIFLCLAQAGANGNRQARHQDIRMMSAWLKWLYRSQDIRGTLNGIRCLFGSCLSLTKATWAGVTFTLVMCLE